MRWRRPVRYARRSGIFAHGWTLPQFAPHEAVLLERPRRRGARDGAGPPFIPTLVSDAATGHGGSTPSMRGQTSLSTRSRPKCGVGSVVPDSEMRSSLGGEAKEIKGLRGSVLLCAAPANLWIDAEIAKKAHFRMGTG